jgi:glycosyltransferase involved in cell wall biosynthesis
MISVILCTYDRASTLRDTLASLQGMHVPPLVEWELLVVDNNSSDDTEDVVTAFQQKTTFNVRYVFEETQGHSRARNRGIQEAKGEILAFTDDDVTVDPHWLHRIHLAYEQFDCIGLGGRIVPVWPCDRPAWLADSGPYQLMKAIVSFDLGDRPRVLRTPPFGANMSFKKVAFERYGLFRTDLGRKGRDLTGGEDTEFGRRLLRNSEVLIYDPTVLIYHPVEEERLTRAYWQRWYFAYGRTSMRLAGDPDAAASPSRRRQMVLRTLASSLVRWILTLDRNRRFYYKLNVYLALGKLREAGARSRRRRGMSVIE